MAKHSQKSGLLPGVSLGLGCSLVSRFLAGQRYSSNPHHHVIYAAITGFFVWRWGINRPRVLQEKLQKEDTELYDQYLEKLNNSVVGEEEETTNLTEFLSSHTIR